MAKSDNFFNIRGKIGNLIFCIRNGKTYVKPYSGGFTQKTTQDHPNIKQSQNRFAQVATFVKVFKQSLIPHLWRLKEGKFHNHLISTFAQLTKQAPNSTLQEVLQNPHTYQHLKNKSLNPNSKISTSLLQYHAHTNALHLGNLQYDLSTKYQGTYLELALGYFQIIDNQPVLTPPEITYLPLDAKSPNASLTLNMPSLSDKSNAHPFIAIAILPDNQPQSSGLHPSHTQTACFL